MTTVTIQEKSHGGVLSDKFGVPPFSVLDSKQGYWLDRKKEWNELGIKSDLGRIENINSLPNATNRPSLRTYVDDEDKSKGFDKVASVSIFDPVLTELSYKWFCPKKGRILDPFTGGSVRGVVASQFGFRYTGFDINQRQVDANYENLAELKFPVAKPNWVCGDADDVKKLTNGSYDMIFSCPPYHDLEIYGKDPRDLSNMSYPKFLEKYKRIIKNSCDMLRDNSFAVFVVSEIRDINGKYKNFVRDTIEAFEECGLEYYNEMIYLNMIGTLPIRTSESFIISRKVGRNHQNIVCMFKGRPSQLKNLDMECEFKPLEELEDKPINDEPKETEELIEEIDGLHCKICKTRWKDQEDFDWHLKRRFHMEQM
jgi:16S rRNA G966 N2-methylase RsmD